MRTIANTVLLLICTGLGLASGYLWRIHLVNEGAHATSRELSLQATTQAGARQRKEPGFEANDSPLATQLERDLAASSGVIKWLCWMAALEKAQPVDFPRLLKLASGNPVAWHFVVNRWIEKAPRHLFDTLAAAARSGNPLPIDLARELFLQWPRHDPEAAIAALTEPDNVAFSTPWRLEVAGAIVATQPELGLKAMADWHIENYGPSMSAVETWAAADPRHAAEFTLAHPSGFASQLTLETVGRVWANSDPAGALDFALSQGGQWASTLANAVLKSWSARDLNAAADWLAFTDESTMNRLSPAFVETWAKQDAPAALSWCQDNLAGVQLEQAVAAVVRGVADKDVAQGAAMVAGMEPGAARTSAAGIVAQKWFPSYPNADPVNPQFIPWLSSLDTDAAKQALGQVAWTWAMSDPKSMAGFLSSASSDEVPAYTDSILARQMARTAPVQALDWAAALPDSRGLGAGSDAFAEWRQSQPVAAMTWLNGLPANDPRYQPFFEKMVQSLVYDSQAADQLATLSPAQQAAAQNIISKMNLSEDQRAPLMASLKPH